MCERRPGSEQVSSARLFAGAAGVLVPDLTRESALAQAGLRKNDVILSINGASTADTKSLLHQTQVLVLGDPLKIGYWRDQYREVHPVEVTMKNSRHQKFAGAVLDRSGFRVLPRNSATGQLSR